MANVIAALATAPGQGGIGIVRLSGEGAGKVLEKIFRPGSGSFPLEDRKMVYGHIVENGKTVDEVLAVCFYAPRSYTGEEVCEIQCHAGTRAIEKILSLCFSAGAVPAQPGEFTKRAFLNGRVDLSQAEAVMDMIGAQSEKALMQAAGQLTGTLKRQILSMQDALTDQMAKTEAALDYPEEDLEDQTLEELIRVLDGLIEETQRLLDGFRQGRLIREGARAAIVGRPNAGKSSLLNALLESERAIVTEIPGTTRDTIEETLIIGGLPIHLIDTAGIRDQGDAVEQIGIQRAKDELKKCDIALWVLDRSQPLTEEDAALEKDLSDKCSLVLFNKQDLPQKLDETAVREKLQSAEFLSVSAKTGDGIGQVRQALFRMLTPDALETEGAQLNSLRHFEAVQQAKAAMERARETAEQGLSPDFAMIDLRDAWSALGQITGTTVHEAIIDRIFDKFCLGK